MEMASGDNWSYKTCKAPVKMSPSINQRPVFYRPDAPGSYAPATTTTTTTVGFFCVTGLFLSPNQQCQSTEGK